MRETEVLFIDEVHRLGRAVEEILYPTMEDFALDFMIGKGPSARSIRLKLPHFTVVGATTRLALLTAPLRSRFGATFRVRFYDEEALEAVVRRAAWALKVEIDDGGAAEIAQRGRGTPRVALSLLRRVRDFAEVRTDGRIVADVTREALELLDVDDCGLDDLDRRVLHTIIEKFGVAPWGRSIGQTWPAMACRTSSAVGCRFSLKSKVSHRFLAGKGLWVEPRAFARSPIDTSCSSASRSATRTASVSGSYPHTTTARATAPADGIVPCTGPPSLGRRAS
jgi:hypothetical protein